MVAPALLFTPGPLTTAPRVREAMARDWGSREPDFIALTAELRQRLLDVAGGSTSHVAVPLQGSGTFVVEAAIATLVGRNDRLLVLVNGAYGERMVEIARRLGRTVEALRWPEDEPVRADAVARALADNPGISHVALVHCETTSGILNPLADIAAAVHRQGRAFLVDAMSSFGALPIDLKTMPITALLASSNKCLEGVPGIAFALVEKQALARAAGQSPSLSFDLHAQWQGFEANGQWRFTPPVQVVAALVEALRALEAEGGPAARRQRYERNCRMLSDGLRDLGFRLLLEDSVQAPIILTIRPPDDPRFDFEALYAALAARGFIIYPGKLTKAPSFRIGCIGALAAEDFHRLLLAFEEAVLAPYLQEPARATAVPSERPQALILAAGSGRRLGEDIPKVLLAFGGRTLLQRHLDALAANGIEDIAVTVGHRGDLVRAELRRIGAEAHVTVIENPRYREGSIVSLDAARALVAARRPLVLMDGDVLYDPRMIRRLLQAPQENVLLLDREIEPGDEPVKICLAGDRIVDFAKRPRLAHDRHGESVGFFRFAPSMAAALAARAAAFVAAGLGQAEYEAAIRGLILASADRFGTADVSDLPWTEIDFPADVARARDEILPRLEEIVHA